MGHHPWRNGMHPGPIWNTNAGMGHMFQYFDSGGPPPVVVGGTFVEVLAAGSVGLTFTTSFDMINHFPVEGGPSNSNWFLLNHSIGESDEFNNLVEIEDDYSAASQISRPFGVFDSFTVYRGIVSNQTVSGDLIVTGRAGDTVSVEAHIAHTATPLTTTSPTWTTVNKFSGAVSPAGYSIISPMMGLTGHHAGQAFMALAKAESSGDIGVYTWDTLAGTSEVLENTILAGSATGDDFSAAATSIDSDTIIVFCFFDNATQEYVVVGKDPTTSTVLFEDRTYHGLVGTTTAAIVLNRAPKDDDGPNGPQQFNFSGTLLGTSTSKIITGTTTGITGEQDLGVIAGAGDRAGAQFAINSIGEVYRHTNNPGDTFILQAGIVDSPYGGPLAVLAADRSANLGAGEALRILNSDGSVYTFHPG